jgi:adenine/guanine phosphoribosyltransferase-like PRPP-binding protein
MPKELPPMIQGSDHLAKIFEGPKIYSKIVLDAMKALKPRSKEFEAIAMRGFSGSLLGPTLAYLLQKHMIIVRKEPGHSVKDSVQGRRVGTYLIVDDFISSGDTIKSIVENIRKHAGTAMTPVGIYLWRGSGSSYSTRISKDLTLQVWQ